MGIYYVGFCVCVYIYREIPSISSVTVENPDYCRFWHQKWIQSSRRIRVTLSSIWHRLSHLPTATANEASPGSSERTESPW